MLYVYSVLGVFAYLLIGFAMAVALTVNNRGERREHWLTLLFWPVPLICGILLVLDSLLCEAVDAAARKVSRR